MTQPDSGSNETQNLESTKTTTRIMNSVLLKIFAYYLIAFISMLLGLFSNMPEMKYDIILYVSACGLLCLPTAYFFSIHTLLYKVKDGNEAEKILAEKIIRGIFAIAITFGTFYMLDIILNVLVENDSRVMMYLKFLILVYCTVFFLCAFFYLWIYRAREKNHKDKPQFRIVRYQLLLPSLITVALSYYTGFVLKYYFTDYIKIYGNRDLVITFIPFYPVIFFAVFTAFTLMGHWYNKDNNKKYMALIISTFAFILLVFVYLAVQSSHPFLHFVLYFCIGILISAFLAVFEGAHILDSVMFDANGSGEKAVIKNYKMFSFTFTLIFIFVFLINNLINIFTIDGQLLAENLLQGNDLSIIESKTLALDFMFVISILIVIVIFNIMFYYVNPSTYDGSKKRFSLGKIILSILACIALGFQLIIPQESDGLRNVYQVFSKFFRHNFYDNPLYILLGIFHLLLLIQFILLRRKKESLSCVRFSCLHTSILLLTIVMLITAWIGTGLSSFERQKMILTEFCLMIYTWVLVIIYVYLYVKGKNHTKIIAYFNGTDR